MKNTNPKILILGQGFLGVPLAKYLGGKFSTSTFTKRLKLITEDDLAPFDILINTAAKTSIDWCENNREEAFDTNTIQAVRLAKLFQGKYIFLSSACIFKSESSFSNNDGYFNDEYSKPNPQCFYTYTKLMAEQLLEEVSPDSLIIRPRMLISEYPHPRNTINKLLSYKNIINTPESVTILEDLLPKIEELIADDAKGPFNIFNEGTISPSQIMTIFQHPHKIITKKQLDSMLVKRGKATRVSTLLKSVRTNPLPNIHTRIKEIKENWGKNA